MGCFCISVDVKQVNMNQTTPYGTETNCYGPQASKQNKIHRSNIQEMYLFFSSKKTYVVIMYRPQTSQYGLERAFTTNNILKKFLEIVYYVVLFIFSFVFAVWC